MRLQSDDLTEVDLTEVHAVDEHIRDCLVTPWLHAGCGVGLAVRATSVLAAVVEVGGDGPAPKPASGVEPEDELDYADFVLDRHEDIVGSAGVAVRGLAEGP